MDSSSSAITTKRRGEDKTGGRENEGGRGSPFPTSANESSFLVPSSHGSEEGKGVKRIRVIGTSDTSLATNGTDSKKNQINPLNQSLGTKVVSFGVSVYKLFKGDYRIPLPILSSLVYSLFDNCFQAFEHGNSDDQSWLIMIVL